MFSGSIPALVTPFRDGAFAERDYRDLIEWQIAEGSSGLVPCGTTGEAATMPAGEHFHAVRVCVEQARGRIPVIAGAGSNDTQVAIANAHAAREVGADAVLMVPPYYNRPEPGRDLPPFRGGPGRMRAPDPALQRSRPHRNRHPGRDDGAA